SAPPSISTAPSTDGASSAAIAVPSPAIAVPPLSKPPDTKKDTAQDAATTTSNSSPSSTPLPGENTAIILSSQGAQKRLVTGAAPKYPAAARSDGAEGTVVLKAVIDEAGKVAGLRLVEGNATLAPAAMQAVKQWRYRPYIRDGKSQPFQTIVIVDFQRQ
ncbi:MAG: energy transducer TonB, partial [Terriglobales bacterium]